MARFLPSFRYIHVCVGISIAALISSNACKITDPDTAAQCTLCATGEDVWKCDVSGVNNPVCGTDEADAETQCSNQLGELGVKYTCEEDDVDEGTGQSDDGEGGGAGWDPGASVAYNSQTHKYEVDDSFVASLFDNPDQLLFDSARLVEQSSGAWVFDDIQTGDLAYLLGLQDGDKPMVINSYSLQSIDDILTALVQLKSETSFNLTILRGGTPLTLSYEVVS